MIQKLSILQKAQIKSWMSEESYDAVHQFYQNRIQEIQSEPITGRNAFEELRALHYKQGRIEELDKFFSDLERQSYE